jgi:NAD(P)-dependent dehydrogenase (short-subunit alcohol dehydrogenase family)
VEKGHGMKFFITGGSRGLGASLVLRAAAAGHDVAFTYRSQQAQAEEIVAQAHQLNPAGIIKCYALDVQDSAQVEAVGNQVIDDFETMDVVVNNAGVSRPGLLVTMRNQDWDEVIATNLTGAFYVCRYFLPVLISNDGGRIINISSVVAHGMSGMVNYAAAKAGLIGLTKTIAKEYGRKNITANVILPGHFETEMDMSEKMQSFWRDFVPTPKGRSGKPDDLADLILFLSSPVGAFINGEALHITGGLDWNP